MARLLGDTVVLAWDSFMADSDRRQREQVTTLHDWKRKKNHLWVDEGWAHARPFFSCGVPFEIDTVVQGV